MSDKKYCCSFMTEFLDDPRIPIGYLPKVREYYMPLVKSSITIQQIFYCPWCGVEFPASLRDLYFDTLEKEHGIDDLDEAEKNGTLPSEFKSDEWWKKKKISQNIPDTGSSRRLKI